MGGFTVNVAVGSRELSLAAESEDRVFLTQHDFRAAAWSLFDRGLMAPLCAKLFDRQVALAAGVGFASRRRRRRRRPDGLHPRLHAGLPA